MSDRICNNDSLIGIFGRNEFQAHINYLAVCNGLFKTDYSGADVTAFNGLVAPTATPSMGVRVKDLAGVSKGTQIGNRKLEDDFIDIQGRCRWSKRHRGNTDPDMVLVVEAADAQARIDLVYAKCQVKRNDLDEDEQVANREHVTLGIKKGTPGAAPVAPEVDASLGEMALAHIIVAPGTTAITVVEITDSRQWIIPSCEQYGDLKSLIDANAAAIAVLRADFETCRLDYDAKFLIVFGEISNLHATDAGLLASIAAINSQITNIHTQIGGINMSLNGLNLTVNDITNRLAPGGDIYEQLTGNSAAIAQLLVDLATLRSDSEGVDADLQTQIDQLVTDLGVFDTSLIAVQTLAQDNAGDITSNYNELTSLINDLGLRLDALEATPNLWTVAEKNAVIGDTAVNKRDIVGLEDAAQCRTRHYDSVNSDIIDGDPSTPFVAGYPNAFALPITGMIQGPGGPPAEVLNEDFEDAVDTNNWNLYDFDVVGGKAVAGSNGYNQIEYIGDPLPTTDKTYKYRMYASSPISDTALDGYGVADLFTGLGWSGLEMPIGWNTRNYQYGPSVYLLFPSMFTGDTPWGADSTPNGYFFTHQSINTSLPNSYTDIEVVIEGGNVKIYLTPEHGGKELAWEATWNSRNIAAESDGFGMADIYSYVPASYPDQAPYTSFDNFEVIAEAPGDIVYEYASSEEVTFQVPASNTLPTLRGFEINNELTVDAGTQVRYDISFDGGSTWEYTDVEADLFDQLYPKHDVASGDLHIKAKLSTADTAKTPVVKFLEFYSYANFCAADIKRTLADMEAEVSQLNADFNEHVTSATANFTNVWNAIRNLESADETLTMMISSLETDMGIAFSIIDTINLDVQNNSTDIFLILNRLSTAGDVGTAINANALAIVALQVQIDAIIAAGPGVDDALVTAVEALQITMTAAQADITNLQTDVVNNAGDISANFTYVTQALSSHDGRLTALEGTPGGIWAPNEKLNALTQIDANTDAISALEVSGSVGPDNKLYLNDLADIESGDHQTILGSPRSFLLPSASSPTLFTEDFETNLDKWDAAVARAAIQDGAINGSALNNTWWAKTSSGLFAAGPKVYKMRMYPTQNLVKDPMLAYRVAPYTYESVVNVCFNPTDANGDKFGISLGWGGGLNGGYFRLLNQLGSAYYLNPYYWTSMTTILDQSTLPASMDFCDFEFELDGSLLRVFATLDGHTRMQLGTITYPLNSQGLDLSTAATGVEFYGQRPYGAYDDVTVELLSGGAVTYAADTQVVFAPSADDVLENVQGYRLNSDFVLPANTDVTVDLSFDAGGTWPELDIVLDADISISPAGNDPADVRVRVNLSTTDDSVTPEVTSFSLRTDKAAAVGGIIDKVNEVLQAATDAADADALLVALKAISQL